MPRTFTDTTGRPWNLIVNVPTMRRVREATGIHLVDLLNPAASEAGKLLDPITRADVLFALVKPEADAAGVTADDFGAAMVGDADAAASRALVEAVCDFLPPAKGEKLRAAFLTAEKAANAEFDALIASQV